MSFANLSLKAAYAIWMRNVTIYKRTWVMNLLPNFFEPVLYLLGMGLGLGYYMSSGMQNQNYIAFIGPGLIASSAMNGACFETTYNMYVRMNFAKVYNAYLASPASVSDIVVGEVMWASTRSVIYGLVFLLILYGFTWFGEPVITSPLAVFAVFLIFLTGVLFAVIGALFTSLIKSINLYAYFFTLFLTPLFLFSGIFYPVDRFPHAETIAWFTPLYHAVRAMRGLTQGPFEWVHIESMIWLVVVTALLSVWIPKHMAKKLLD